MSVLVHALHILQQSDVGNVSVVLRILYFRFWVLILGGSPMQQYPHTNLVYLCVSYGAFLVCTSFNSQTPAMSQSYYVFCISDFEFLFGGDRQCNNIPIQISCICVSLMEHFLFYSSFGNVSVVIRILWFVFWVLCFSPTWENPVYFLRLSLMECFSFPSQNIIFENIILGLSFIWGGF